MNEARTYSLDPQAYTRAELESWDDQYLWHPFTPQSRYRDESPLLIVAAEGSELIDIDGKRYLDSVSSLWCNALGHRRPELDAAIKKQLELVAHATLLGNANLPAILLAKRLIEISPAGLDRVFFSDSGSTTVEVALKMSLQYWQLKNGGKPARRKRFLALSGAYHGDTIGSVSLGGIEAIRGRFAPLVFDVLRAPATHCETCRLDHDPSLCHEACLAEIEGLIAREAENIAAVVIEPGFQGAAGIITYPPQFLQRVEAATRAAGAHLILDEVAVGMGRCGELFVSAHEGVHPDFLCLAKGLTGGYLPLAATLTSAAIYEAFLGAPEEGRTFLHGHTFTGNPLGAAVALASLDIFCETDLMEQVKARIKTLSAELETLKALPKVGEIRQYGLAAGIEIVAEKFSREPFPSKERRGMRVAKAMQNRGIFMRPLGDVAVIMPPLIISDQEIHRIVAALGESIQEVCES